MYSGYVIRLCIQAINSGYVFRLSIPAIYSGYLFQLPIQAIYSGYLFRPSTQAIYLKGSALPADPQNINFDKQNPKMTKSILAKTHHF